jgi:glycosyltransferase involved in cell wall biosynthesis
MPHRIALVIPGFNVSGGMRTVGLFLRRVMQASERYTPEIIAPAMGAFDAASTQVTRPGTWTRGPQVKEKVWNDIPYRHVGARWSEFEWQRYRPRPPLTALLRDYDLVQIVAGTPPWAHVARHVDVPVALQVATLTRVEREGQHIDEGLPRRLWHAGMTHVVSRMERAVPSLVDAIFVENTWMYDHFQDRTDPGRVHFAPPGVDTDLYRPLELGEENGNYILTVGRLGDSRKNVRLLFEAYHRLRQQLDSAPRLVLAGLTGPSARAWARAEALGIRDHVEMHEAVPEDELASLYRKARLFVLSSNEEGLGLVIAEAMASGTPVVSTDCGGPSTLIDDGDTGVLVPTGDAAALADRMAHLLTHPEAADAMGRAGRDRVEKEFSISAAGARFLRVYDDLLAS